MKIIGIELTSKTQGVESLERKKMKKLNKVKIRKLVCASLLFIGCTIQVQGQRQRQDPFVTTWEIAAGDSNITIPTSRVSTLIYNYTVDWGDGVFDTTTYTGDATHNYSTAGTYTVTISGDFPAISFQNYAPQVGDNSLKIKTIKSWGTLRWLTLFSAFAGCQNLTTIEDGAGAPDLTMVNDMANMFFGANNFNGDLSSWDVSNVRNMGSTFSGATSFNGDLSSWNVSNVSNMNSTFSGATSFTSDLSSWNVSNVTDMVYMFFGANNFNQDISSWDVSKVTSMESTFASATKFNSDVSNWNVSNVTDMVYMFFGANNFNQDLSSWNVSNVTSMLGTFESASSFNGNISAWNVSNVSNMAFTFWEATSFDGDLSTWNVSNVTNMMNTFANASSFNQDLSNWDVPNVTSMVGTFFNATNFNQDLSSWNVSNVTLTAWMFSGATSFNSDLSTWNVSNVTDMNNKFSGATNFNSDLSSWDVSNVFYLTDMLTNATSFSSENYDALLTGWSSLSSLQDDVVFGAPPTTYCNGKTGRGILTGTYNWDITGDNGEDCTAVTSVDDEFLSNTKIYPNPTNDKISIESSFEIDKLELYNVLGAKLFSVSKTNVLDLAGLSQGIYILKVFSADRVFAKKVIKD